MLMRVSQRVQEEALGFYWACKIDHLAWDWVFSYYLDVGHHLVGCSQNIPGIQDKSSLWVLSLKPNIKEQALILLCHTELK